MPTTDKVVNRLIQDLPPKPRAKLLKLCKPVKLAFGDILCEAGHRIRYVYFPLTAFISLVGSVRNHPPMEISIIGNEGMLGDTVVLGVDRARLRSVVQGAGIALRMSVIHFQREVSREPALRRTLNRYLFVLLAQQAQNVMCSRFHAIKARHARWLLLTHDRAHADHFRLTHKFLADMLGVQRSAVSIAANALQKRKVIRYFRGQITVLDRRKLEAAACECYRAELADHQQLFG